MQKIYCPPALICCFCAETCFKAGFLERIYDFKEGIISKEEFFNQKHQENEG